MGFDDVGDRIEARVERLRLARLDEPQMALRQSQLVAARQRSDDGDCERLDRLDHEPAMPLAADAVEDDARDHQALVIGRAAHDDGRGRLRLARDVDDKEHGHAESGGDVGRGAAASRRGRHAVEEPHRGLAERQRTAHRSAPRQRGQEVRRHRPGIEIDALDAGRGGVKSRIDIVGAGLEADDGEAAPTEGAQEAEHDRGLAAARTGRGDHEAPGQSGASEQSVS